MARVRDKEGLLGGRGRFVSSRDLMQAVRETYSDMSSEDLLGYVVLMELEHSNRSPSEFETICTDTIGARYIPRKPSRKRAVLRALRVLKAKHIGPDGFVRKIRDDNGVFASVIVGEHVDDSQSDPDVEFEKRNMVVYNADTGSVRCTTSYLKDEFLGIYAALSGAYTHEDWRRIVLGWLKERGSIMLRRKGGGAYFLPASVDPSGLEAFLACLGGVLHVYPLFDTKRSRREVRSAFVDDMERSLADTAEAIADMKRRKAGKRDTTYLKRLDEFKELQEQAGMYASLLELEKDGLMSRVKQTGKLVEAALTGHVEQFELSQTIPVGSEVLVTTKNGVEGGRVVGYKRTGANGQYEYLKVRMTADQSLRIVTDQKVKFKDDVIETANAAV